MNGPGMSHRQKATENKRVLEIVGAFLRDKRFYKLRGKKLPAAFVPLCATPIFIPSSEVAAARGVGCWLRGRGCADKPVRME